MAQEAALSIQPSEEALSSQHSAISQDQNQDQKQRQRYNLLTPEQQAEALVRRIGETCDELESLAKENPDVVGRVTRREKEPKDSYLRLKSRLELADAMPRCRWIKQGGTTCGSPQMKNHIYCFAHIQMAEAQALALRLPPPEDANAIQVGLMRIQKALIEDTITTRKAGLLLYSMQLALTNVGQTTFGQAKDEELVLETVDEEEAISEKALSSQPSAFSGRQNQHQHQRPFTAKDAKDAKENGERQNRQQNQNLFTTEDAENAEGSSERQNQNQDQNQRPFTAKNAEDATENGERQNRRQNQNLFTTKDAENAEGSSERQNQNQDQNQRPFTAEDAKNATENQGLPIKTDDTDRKSLPQMHADRRGVQQRTKQIEWKPSPDMYRMDTREGREAYETSLRTKIEPRPCAEGRPPQPGMVPDDREPYAVLG